MKIYLATLALLVLGASAQLDALLDSYTYSNIKHLTSNSLIMLLWTPGETSIDFAVVGRMNFAGNEHCKKDGCWMGTGWYVFNYRHHKIRIAIK